MTRPVNSFDMSVYSYQGLAIITITGGSGGGTARYAYGGAFPVAGIPQGVNIIHCGRFQTPVPTSANSFGGRATFGAGLGVMGRYPFNFSFNGQSIQVMFPPTVLNLNLPTSGRMTLITLEQS